VLTGSTSLQSERNPQTPVLDAAVQLAAAAVFQQKGVEGG